MSGWVWDCNGKSLDLSQPCVMGILNITPDSFSDGGFFMSAENAIQQALRMVAEGAAIIDVGGESTRPGAEPVSTQQELDRVIPVVEALSKELEVPISIDTSKPQVMSAAVQAGAGLINDVCALRAPGALEAAAQSGVPVCLMHMRGEPRTMQQAPQYTDLLVEVREFLRQRIDACVGAGIDINRIIVDPGFGFGKTPLHNLRLIKNLSEFEPLSCPILVGVSLKSSIGALLDRPVDQRLAGSLILTAMALERGARIIRAHDVAPTVDAVRMMRAFSDA